eukprot:SAG11_NODE_16799_length_537_cov_1.057078_1_plen_143_part_01
MRRFGLVGQNEELRYKFSRALRPVFIGNNYYMKNKPGTAAAEDAGAGVRSYVHEQGHYDLSIYILTKGQLRSYRTDSGKKLSRSDIDILHADEVENFTSESMSRLAAADAREENEEAGFLFSAFDSSVLQQMESVDAQLPDLV